MWDARVSAPGRNLTQIKAHVYVCIQARPNFSAQNNSRDRVMAGPRIAAGVILTTNFARKLCHTLRYIRHASRGRRAKVARETAGFPASTSNPRQRRLPLSQQLTTTFYKQRDDRKVTSLCFPFVQQRFGSRKKKLGHDSIAR